MFETRILGEVPVMPYTLPCRIFSPLRASVLAPVPYVVSMLKSRLRPSEIALLNYCYSRKVKNLIFRPFV